jgi:hypothetical protein
VFNLDKGSEPGSHWVVLFFEFGQVGSTPEILIEYFDSTGSKPIKNISDLIKSLTKNHKTRVRVNTICHQKGKTECGVYSLFYTLQRLSGHSMDEINALILDDDVMHTYRQNLFRKHT